MWNGESDEMIGQECFASWGLFTNLVRRGSFLDQIPGHQLSRYLRAVQSYSKKTSGKSRVWLLFRIRHC